MSSNNWCPLKSPFVILSTLCVTVLMLWPRLDTADVCCNHKASHGYINFSIQTDCGYVIQNVPEKKHTHKTVSALPFASLSFVIVTNHDIHLFTSNYNQIRPRI